MELVSFCLAVKSCRRWLVRSCMPAETDKLGLSYYITRRSASNKMRWVSNECYERVSKASRTLPPPSPFGTSLSADDKIIKVGPNKP